MKLGRIDARQADLAAARSRASSHVVHRLAAADFQADLLHRLLELLAVLGLVDHVGLGADHLDAVLLQHAVLRQIHRQVQARLPAERRQQRIGPLGLDDLGDDLPGERLDVRPVGHVRDRS